MKQEFDKEMDSLLKRPIWAGVPDRREESHAAASESTHLDADELSAYAEGALPAPARTLYAAHLADCDACRKIVVNLSSAADAAGELERRAPVVNAAAQPAKASGWRAWATSVFTWPSLRYAAPLFAFVLIVAIAFFAFNPRRNGTQIAGVTETRPVDSGAVPNEETNASATGGVNVPEPNRNASTGDALNTAATNGATSGVTPAGSPEQPRGVVGAKTTNVPTTREEAAGVPDGAETQGSVTHTGTAAVAPPTVTFNERRPETRDADAGRRATGEETDALYAQRQMAESRAAAQLSRQRSVQSPDGGSPVDSRSRAAPGMTVSAPPPPAPSRTQPAPAKPRSASPSSAKEESESHAAATPVPSRKDDEQTRNAAGHRFRRRNGGAWIDVNYNSSMRIRSVRRNSEEFRALVADLPELGRVAEQLGGEVVVVVGGRAYRIR